MLKNEKDRRQRKQKETVQRQVEDGSKAADRGQTKKKSEEQRRLKKVKEVEGRLYPVASPREERVGTHPEVIWYSKQAKGNQAALCSGQGFGRTSTQANNN